MYVGCYLKHESYSTALEASSCSACGVDVSDPSLSELGTQGISPTLSCTTLIPPVPMLEHREEWPSAE